MFENSNGHRMGNLAGGFPTLNLELEDQHGKEKIMLSDKLKCARQ